MSPRERAAHALTRFFWAARNPSPMSMADSEVVARSVLDAFDLVYSTGQSAPECTPNPPKLPMPTAAEVLGAVALSNYGGWPVGTKGAVQLLNALKANGFEVVRTAEDTKAVLAKLQNCMTEIEGRNASWSGRLGDYGAGCIVNFLDMHGYRIVSA